MPKFVFPLQTTEPTTGVSDPAQYAEAEFGEVEDRLRDSFSLGNGIRSAMDDLCAEAERCARPNWDGFGARPVVLETYRRAYAFLEALPLGTPGPTVSAEPDGQLSLEWYRNVRRVLSVSVSTEGDLHYAALMGPNKAYGTEAFLGQIPARILTLINEVAAA